MTDVAEKDLATLTQCPVTLQHYIAKSYELRIPVIDDGAFAVRIDSQLAGGRTAVDWRNFNLPKTPHSAYDLPPDVKLRLVQLNRRLGVRYSSVDMIVDPSGTYWFLEANITGQWLWLDDLVGLGITDALVNAILK